MKKKLLSIILLFSLITTNFTINIGAIANHQYYSQWGNNTGVDNKLCAITCLSMIITDLGTTATPSEVYESNGRNPVASWRTIGTKYGINIREVPLPSTNPSVDKDKIISLLIIFFIKYISFFLSIYLFLLYIKKSLFTIELARILL